MALMTVYEGLSLLIARDAYPVHMIQLCLDIHIGSRMSALPTGLVCFVNLIWLVGYCGVCLMLDFAGFKVGRVVILRVFGVQGIKVVVKLC